MSMKVQLGRAWPVVAVLFYAAILVPASQSAANEAALSPQKVMPDHHGLTADEFSAQSRRVLRRAPKRIRIYGPREPGPNSVRICNAHYEQEYRPSGTVIVPRMQCYWSG